MDPLSSVPEKELPGPACEGGRLGGGSGERGEGAIHHLFQPGCPALQASLLLQPRLQLLLQPGDRLAGAAAHPASLLLHLAEVHPVTQQVGGGLCRGIQQEDVSNLLWRMKSANSGEENSAILL